MEGKSIPFTNGEAERPRERPDLKLENLETNGGEHKVWIPLVKELTVPLLETQWTALRTSAELKDSEREAFRKSLDLSGVTECLVKTIEALMTQNSLPANPMLFVSQHLADRYNFNVPSPQFHARTRVIVSPNSISPLPEYPPPFSLPAISHPSPPLFQSAITSSDVLPSNVAPISSNESLFPNTFPPTLTSSFSNYWPNELPPFFHMPYYHADDADSLAKGIPPFKGPISSSTPAASRAPASKPLDRSHPDLPNSNGPLAGNPLAQSRNPQTAAPGSFSAANGPLPPASSLGFPPPSAFSPASTTEFPPASSGNPNTSNSVPMTRPNPFPLVRPPRILPPPKGGFPNPIAFPNAPTPCANIRLGAPKGPSVNPDSSSNTNALPSNRTPNNSTPPFVPSAVAKLALSKSTHPTSVDRQSYLEPDSSTQSDSDAQPGPRKHNQSMTPKSVPSAGFRRLFSNLPPLPEESADLSPGFEPTAIVPSVSGSSKVSKAVPSEGNHEGSTTGDALRNRAPSKGQTDDKRKDKQASGNQADKVNCNTGENSNSGKSYKDAVNSGDERKPTNIPKRKGDLTNPVKEKKPCKSIAINGEENADKADDTVENSNEKVEKREKSTNFGGGKDEQPTGGDRKAIGADQSVAPSIDTTTKKLRENDKSPDTNVNAAKCSVKKGDHSTPDNATANPSNSTATAGTLTTNPLNLAASLAEKNRLLEKIYDKFTRSEPVELAQNMENVAQNPGGTNENLNITSLNTTRPGQNYGHMNQTQRNPFLIPRNLSQNSSNVKPGATEQHTSGKVSQKLRRDGHSPETPNQYQRPLAQRLSSQRGQSQEGHAAHGPQPPSMSGMTSDSCPDVECLDCPAPSTPVQHNTLHSPVHPPAPSNSPFQNCISPNGPFQNCLSPNRPFQNGPSPIGHFQNCPPNNGPFPNYPYSNGPFQNNLGPIGPHHVPNAPFLPTSGPFAPNSPFPLSDFALSFPIEISQAQTASSLGFSGPYEGFYQPCDPAIPPQGPGPYQHFGPSNGPFPPFGMPGGLFQSLGSSNGPYQFGSGPQPPQSSSPFQSLGPNNGPLGPNGLYPF